LAQWTNTACRRFRSSIQIDGVAEDSLQNQAIGLRRRWATGDRRRRAFCGLGKQVRRRGERSAAASLFVLDSVSGTDRGHRDEQEASLQSPNNEAKGVLRARAAKSESQHAAVSTGGICSSKIVGSLEFLMRALLTTGGRMCLVSMGGRADALPPPSVNRRVTRAWGGRRELSD
jgi:hypothetical protein